MSKGAVVMQTRKIWIFASVIGLMSLLVLWTGGCDTRVPPINDNEKQSGESGSEHNTTDSQSQADAAVTDTATGSDSSVKDLGNTDTSLNDTGTVDTGTTDTSTADTGTADNSTADTGTTDTGTQDQAGADQPGAVECDKRGGYCLTAADPNCKKGYVAVNNPMGCGNPIPTCCLPTTPPKCGLEGDTISLNETCCPGLTKGTAASPPNCVTTGQKFICVNCGDGTCDTSKGENNCSCPKDCPNTQNTCDQNGGICTNTGVPCQPGSQVDQTLACSSLKQQCCVKQNSQCKSDKDCPDTCSGTGTCTITTYKCKVDTCVGDSKVTQPNASCDSSSNKCVPLSKGCKSDCDCSQGLLCVKQGGVGQCIAGTKPAYCCDKAGCPVGAACTDSNGTAGTCKAATDCTNKGGYCAIQFQPCRAGYTASPKTSCGPSLSLQCCLPTKDLCAGVKCAAPTCASTSAGTCTQTESTCDPTTGQCVKTSKTSKITCSTPAGGGCLLSTPYCKNNQCVATISTKTPACTQSGTTCIKDEPICSNNQCIQGSKKMENHTCEADGVCRPKTSPGCTSHCDCTQGLLCANGCRAGFVPTYCCDNPGCPSGQACTFRNGNKDFCP